MGFGGPKEIKGFYNEINLSLIHILEELTKYDFILTEKNMSYRKHLDELMASKSLQIRPFLELGSVEMIRTLVERGIGISFLPCYAVKDSIKNGTLVKIDVSENQIEVWRQLIYHNCLLYTSRCV